MFRHVTLVLYHHLILSRPRLSFSFFFLFTNIPHLDTFLSPFFLLCLNKKRKKKKENPFLANIGSTETMSCGLYPSNYSVHALFFSFHLKRKHAYYWFQGLWSMCSSVLVIYKEIVTRSVEMSCFNFLFCSLVMVIKLYFLLSLMLNCMSCLRQGK